MHIKHSYPGAIRDLQPMPESGYRNRRAILKTLGLGVLGGFYIPQASCSREEELQPGSGSSIPDIETAPGEFSPKFDMSEHYPAKRNEKNTLDRPITDEQVASRFNNFYEFTTGKDLIWKMVDKFVDAPWEVEVSGLVEKPLKMDFTEFIQNALGGTSVPSSVCRNLGHGGAVDRVSAG